MAEMLIVGSKVKAFIKSKGCMTAGDTLEALNRCVEECLAKACDRAKGNKRATVKPQDL
jgi:histone H3/H4